MMKKDKFVTINGKRYDTTTGLPILNPAVKKPSIHSVSQKSRVVQNVATISGNVARSTASKIGRSMDISRSKTIARFATKKESLISKTPVTNRRPDIGPIKHPLAAKVEAQQNLRRKQLSTASTPKSSKMIKQEAIAEAMKNVPEKPKKEKNIFKRHNKFINVFSISIILCLIAGYLTYMNIPSLSVRVASAQAGINATFPDYYPDGYRLDGPVTYSKGQVSIKFHANTGSRAFVIKQVKSSWDSSAVKSKIDKESPDGTNETTERGLRIFYYDNNTKAAWVNGGILYSISGNAPLGSDQIRRIATSLIDK